MVEELTAAKFEQAVLKNKQPVVVEVYTESCPNCKVLDPIFQETESANNQRFGFFKINAQEHISIAKKYKVLGVPTLLFFAHGKLVDRKVGVRSRQKIEKRLLPLLNMDVEQASKKEITGYFKLPWK